MGMVLKINKKSQMEIMGLLVIILLLAIAMLFTVRYMIHREPSEAKKSFTESQMASNIMSAILKTSTPLDISDPLYCHKVDFTELLQDCATFKSIDCYNGMGSCRYAETYITEMLEKTLAKWNRPYRFSAWRVGGDELFPPIDTPNRVKCIKENVGPEKEYEDRKTKLSPVPLNPGTLMVQFDICS